MVAVHTFITEVLADLVYSFEATHDKTLQIKLCGDTHIHILVERIEVGDERTGRCSTGNTLQGGSLNLGVTVLVEHVSQCPQHSGTLQESIFYSLINHQVNITLTVTQFGIIKLIVCHTVFVFDDRQRFQTLTQQGHLLGVYRYLTGLCAEHESFNADEVTDVKQSLEGGVVDRLSTLLLFCCGISLAGGVDIVAGDIHLYSTFGILYFCEGCLTHHTATHHTAGDTYLAWLILITEVITDIYTKSVGGVCGSWVRIDTHVAQLLQTLASANLLFTEF